MLQEKYEYCKCGSGLKYKFCHMKLHLATGEKRLQASHELYLKQWEHTSSFFYEKGYYKWMAEQLSHINPEVILDIGCGSGYGIVELINQFGDQINLLSLEENRECIKTAQKNILRHCGVDCSVSERIIVKHHMSSHSYDHEPINFTELANINLIESDLLTDPHLGDIKNYFGEFDLITIWLIGSHNLRDECKQIHRNQYRLQVQNKVYDLADIFLKKGGVLNIVDRGELPSNQHLIDDIINSHRDQAKGTGLDVKGVEFIEYEEPDIGISLKIVPGSSGRVVENPTKSFSSIIVEKK